MRYLLILLLAGCASIDMNNRDPGWPKDMKVYEMTVPANWIGCWCRSSLMFVAFACTSVDPKSHVAVMILPPDAPKWMRDHEEKHAQGYMHYGDSRPASWTWSEVAEPEPPVPPGYCHWGEYDVQVKQVFLRGQ